MKRLVLGYSLSVIIVIAEVAYAAGFLTYPFRPEDNMRVMAGALYSPCYNHAPFGAVDYDGIGQIDPNSPTPSPSNDPSYPIFAPVRSTLRFKGRAESKGSSDERGFYVVFEIDEIEEKNIHYDYFYRFFHLYQQTGLEIGDIVVRGQFIGWSGNTGYFMKDNDTPDDPSDDYPSMRRHIHLDVYRVSEGKLYNDSSIERIDPYDKGTDIFGVKGVWNAETEMCDKEDTGKSYPRTYVKNEKDELVFIEKSGLMGSNHLWTQDPPAYANSYFDVPGYIAIGQFPSEGIVGFSEAAIKPLFKAMRDEFVTAYSVSSSDVVPYDNGGSAYVHKWQDGNDWLIVQDVLLKNAGLTHEESLFVLSSDQHGPRVYIIKEGFYWLFMEHDGLHNVGVPFNNETLVSPGRVVHHLAQRKVIRFWPGCNQYQGSVYEVVCGKKHAGADVSQSRSAGPKIGQPNPSDISCITNDLYIGDKNDRRAIHIKQADDDPSEEERLAFQVADGLNDVKNLRLYESYCRKYPAEIILTAYVRAREVSPERIKKSRGALFNFLVQKYGGENKNNRGHFGSAARAAGDGGGDFYDG